MKWRAIGAVATFLSLEGMAAASPLPAAPSPALEKVTLQLKWTHQFQFAGYYAALVHGYYREAGLDVALRPAVPGDDPVDIVLAGKAEYGVGNSALALERAQGKPVVMLADIFQHSPLVLLARGDRGIESLEQLHDKPIMMEPLSAELLAYFKDEGIDPSRLRLVPHTFNMADLLAGKVAAMSAYVTDEPYLLQFTRVPTQIFTPRAGGIDFYGDNLFTTDAEVRRHPARARAFRAASLRGWEYAMAHPQELVEEIHRNWNPGRTLPQLAFEAAKTAPLLDADVVEIGHVNPGRWRRIADTYAEFGMMPRDFSLKGFLYDPDPRPDLRWLNWTLAGLGAASLALLLWALPLAALNRRLREADAAKGRYMAVMSHEIRSSLCGIQGIARLMAEDLQDAERREDAAVLAATAERMLLLIDNVLDYSKLEADRMEAQEAPLELASFLDGLCRLFRPAAEAKGIALSWRLEEGAPAAVATDALRLQQIVTNLLSNAVKFTAQGAVAVAVRGRLRADGRWLLWFEVRDSGPGIAPAEAERLFQPYRQATASVSREYGGTGLGLAISRRLARLLGGDVTLESAPGRGSAFTARIEAGRAGPAGAEPPSLS